MVYTGGNFSLTGHSGIEMAYALPPCVIDTHFITPFEPAVPQTLQVNFMSDCAWTQAVWGFDIYDTQPLPIPPGYDLIQEQLSYGVSTWNVQPYLTMPNLQVFQPTPGSSITNNVGVTDFNGNPIMVSDLMSGRYFARVVLLQGTIEMMIMDGATPVWFSNKNVPYLTQGVPKVVNTEYVGVTNGQGVEVASGSLATTYSTTQTHDSLGNLIEPYPFDVIAGGDPSFKLPSGLTQQYADETGESINLGTSWIDGNLSNPMNEIIVSAGVLAA